MSQAAANPSVASRSVARIINSTRTSEGDGMIVQRVFPGSGLQDLDPFLLLDEMGPIEFAAGQNSGFPDHPHRGFETVTYLLEGVMEHRDSRGNHGVLKPGDVQWMTAGSGLVHSEMPGAELRRTGGRLHGFQLWVNLPRTAKMVEPRYQEMPAARIPAGKAPGVEAKIIAGEALGENAAIETRTPIFYLHYELQPGASTVHKAPHAYNVFAYVIEGQAGIGPESAMVSAGQMALFSKDGDDVRLANSAGAEKPVSLLLIGGQPLGDPVARYGPFVMNTKEELYRAFEDYRAGRMGAITRR